jgi:DNA-binding response OmpR family regulator
MRPMASVTTPRTVLVVEDELPVRELLRLHLGLAGFEIEEVADGKDALRRAREMAFDLLILDVMLPGFTRRCCRPGSARTRSGCS